MNNTWSTRNHRRYKAFISSYNSNYIQKRSPLVVSWWSAAFPGLGHLILGLYMKGFILFSWEFFININSNINLGILYSFTGRYELAKEVLNTKWVLLYMPVYVTSIWDSYRLSVDINKLVPLVNQENAPIVPYKLTAFAFNFLDKRPPIIAALLSIFLPGLGHLYMQRLPTGFFLLLWTITTLYFSQTLEAIHYLAVGELQQSISILNPEWFLFLPSIYSFAIFDAYRIAVGCNNLYREEQSQFLKRKYHGKKLRINTK